MHVMQAMLPKGINLALQNESPPSIKTNYKQTKRKKFLVHLKLFTPVDISILSLDHWRLAEFIGLRDRKF